MTSTEHLRSETTIVRDISVHQVWSAGEGPTVVLLHGLAEDARSWAVIQRALPEFRTVAVELRGHGKTTLGAADGTLTQLSNDLISFLEDVTGPARVVGFSLGGTITLDAAASRPDLFHRVVVVGASSVVGRAAADFYRRRIALVETGDPDSIRQALREDTAPAVVQETDLNELVQHRLEAIGEGGGYINAARAMAALSQTPLTPRLGLIPQRVDIIGADRDTFCPRKAADILVDGLPDARYHELSGSGHLIAVDQPTALAAQLAAVLDDSG